MSKVSASDILTRVRLTRAEYLQFKLAAMRRQQDVAELWALLARKFLIQQQPVGRVPRNGKIAADS